MEKEIKNNVRHLIDFLETIEDKENTAVVLEGCDCYGDWNGLGEVKNDDKYLISEPYTKYLLLNRLF